MRILIIRVDKIVLNIYCVMMMTYVKGFMCWFLAYNCFYFRLYVAARIFLLAINYPIQFQPFISLHPIHTVLPLSLINTNFSAAIAST